MSLINRTNSKINIRTCRICLDAESGDMISIEEQNGWLSLFEICFGFTLTIQDVPRLLCQSCAEKVQSYVKFKEKCLKSHDLWKLVISDVKCHIVKYQNDENPNETVTNVLEIKNEPVDHTFDSDFSIDDDNEMVKFSSIEIEIEIPKEDIKTTIEESNENKNDCIGTNPDNSKHVKHKNGNGKANKTDQNIYNTGSITRIQKKNYTCSKCKESYEGKYWYDKHKKICRAKIGKRIYDQEYSYDLGRKYDDQNIDMVKQEPQNKMEIIGNKNDSLFSCGLCHLSFFNTKDGFIHLDDHWSSNDLACKLCDFVGIDLAAIISHRFSHVPRNKLRFVCHICEKNQCSLIALHFHYRKEHLKKPGGYCSRCNKEYSRLRYWKKHEKRHVAPKYTCDICKKTFTLKSNLKGHIIDHMRIVTGVCDICGIVLSRQRYIELHKEAVHNHSPVKCTHCNRMFKNQYSLIKHQKRLAEEKPCEVKCEVCHKAFGGQRGLKQHMVMHSGEKPYKCDTCGSSYKRKAHLINHLYKHKVNLPQCQICMKPFSCPASLKRHSSVHTGVRKYACTATNCGKSFYHKKVLMVHLQRRHKSEGLEKSEVLQEEVV
ncbi:hypothetical protein PYW07_002411 [Mythimna separata]|uniref:Uncharacterized protein n=1 Tax=Mythimna separata TaxID=271217 RepID=A0AAD7YM92_MYTSE|nr:hypothetical protein PYW07_002411 [Mythimna separata]